MYDKTVLNLMLAFVLVLNGVVSLRNAKAGFRSGQQFVTLGKNPVEPEPMTPRMRRLTRFSGVAALFVAVLIVCVTVYQLFRG